VGIVSFSLGFYPAFWGPESICLQIFRHSVTKSMATHGHQQGRTLQWMRTAPKQPNRHHSATRSQSPHDYQDIDPTSNHFARDAESSSHFQVLDDKGLAIEQQRIDDAARRVLSRRKKGPSKAWGTPASTQEDYRRSLMPRSPKSRTESKPRSPQRRHNQLSKEDSDVLNYAFIPESERLQRAADQANMASRPSTAGVDGDRKRGGAGRKTNSGLEEIPSDFVDKLHVMRNNSVAEEKELEEKYEADKTSPARANSNRHHKKGSPVKSWTNAVREAFVDERNPTNNETKKRRPNSKRSSRPVRKKASTVPQPFAGVEARSTIKTVSRSMERVMADLALKHEEEEKAAQYKWHAKPIPRAVKENRYQAILDKAEATRIKESAARKQRLNETLQPFPGLERREKEGKRKKQQKEEQRLAALAAEKMEAKRKKERSQRKFRQAAAKSAAAEQDRGAADVERRARVQRRAAKLLHSSKMPARMEMWEKTKKQNAQDNQEQDHNGAMTNKMKLNKISSMDAGDIRKYFQRSQMKFKKSLQQARQSRPKAASRPFAFMSAERKVQEAARRKQTEERLQRTEDKRILEKTKKERRQKELAKKLKGMKHVSVF